MDPIQIKKLIKYYFRKILLFIILIIIATIISIIYAIKIKVPMYKSSTTLVLTKLNQNENVIVQEDDETSNKTEELATVEETYTTEMTEAQQYEYNSYVLVDYCNIATTDKVLGDVKEELGLDDTIKELKSKISVTEIESANMMEIKAIYEDAETAKNIVEKVSEKLQEESKKIYAVNNIYDLKEAKVADEPYNAGIIKNVLVGIAIGFLIAFIIVTLMYYFNDKEYEF